jgi:pimeloyl-ACP methyl ester carboxylesterase
VRTFAVGIPGGSIFVYEWGEPVDPTLLYWDGLGGTGLHANELAPILAGEHGLRVIAPDPPGHGRSPALPSDSYRPSRLAALATDLLSELDIEHATFLGFSWGGRVGCSFAARFPERTAGLALVEGGIFLYGSSRDLAACVAEAREELEAETFASWALPDAHVEAIPNAIHDLVSFAPERVASCVGEFVTAQPPP